MVFSEIAASNTIPIPAFPLKGKEKVKRLSLLSGSRAASASERYG